MPVATQQEALAAQWEGGALASPNGIIPAEEPQAKPVLA